MVSKIHVMKGLGGMDKAFKAAAQHYISEKPALTHSQEVCRLYRISLRMLQSWAINRDVFNEEGVKLRDEFKKNMDVPLKQGKVLLAKGQEQQIGWTHPDRYLLPYLPGGSLFMRNPPLPLVVCYPHGIPEGASHRELNVDMSNVHEGAMAQVNTARNCIHTVPSTMITSPPLLLSALLSFRSRDACSSILPIRRTTKARPPTATTSFEDLDIE
jgi:NADH dehydrogenase (ubiquinone) 1 beta subcomplex subunit 9